MVSRVRITVSVNIVLTTGFMVRVSHYVHVLYHTKLC